MAITCLAAKGCGSTRNANQKLCTPCHKAHEAVDAAKLAAATASGEYTGGSAGTSPAPTTPSPATPPVTPATIQVTETEITQVGNRLTIKVEVKTNKIIAVRMKKGMKELCMQSTDSNREVIFTHHEDLEDAARSVTLKFITPDDQVATANIDVPAKVVAPAPPKPDDPEEVQVTVWENFTNTTPPVMTSGVHVRVINSAGNGLPGEATIFCNNTAKPKEITIDKFGCGVFTYPDPIGEDESIGIQVAVSGIKDKASVNLLNLKPLPNMPVSYGERFRKSNNFRAVIFAIIMVVVWVICATTFWCSPMLSEAKIISTSQTAIISQYEDKVAEMMQTGKIIERDNLPPPKTPDTGAVNSVKAAILVLTILYTAFVVIYSICAMREEFAYYMRKWSVKLMQRRQGSAQDPIQERIAKIYGAFGHVQKTPTQPQITTTTTIGTIPTAPSEKHEDTSFWRLLRSDLVSDFIMNILYPMLGRALK